MTRTYEAWVVLAAAVVITFSGSFAAASDCTNSCDDGYYACTNTSSVGDCSHYRSMCYQSCTLNSPALQFGAIAYSPSANKYGTSARYPNQSDAEQRSIEECRKHGGKDDCKALWFREPNCGALATGPPNRWSSKWAASRDEATAVALKTCGDGGAATCTLDVAICATDALE